MEDVLENKPSSEDAPKVLIKYKRTGRFKPGYEPRFTVGELVPWKSMWFQLVAIEHDSVGFPLMVLRPQGEVIPNEAGKKPTANSGLSGVQAKQDLRGSPEVVEKALGQQAEALPDSPSKAD
jgi:hypothetical protein